MRRRILLQRMVTNTRVATNIFMGMACLASLIPLASLALPAQGPGKTVAVAPGKKHVQVTDAMLRSMARKAGRAKPARFLGKTGPTTLPKPTSTLATIAATHTRQSLALLHEPYRSGMRVEWSSNRATPIFLSGPALSSFRAPSAMTRTAAPGAVAQAFFQANRDLFHLSNPSAELELREHIRDDMGFRHEVFQQMHQGIPVWGAFIHAHTDKNGNLYAVNARYSPTPSLPVKATYRITDAVALKSASTELASHVAMQEFTPELRALLDYSKPVVEKNVWVSPDGNASHWAWRVEIRPNIRDCWRYFIDGQTGAVLEKYNITPFDGPNTASAADLKGETRSLNTYQVGAAYYLIDATRKTFNPKSALPGDPKGALWTLDAAKTDLKQVYQVTSSNNTWNDPSAVSAHANMGLVYEYYLKTFNRVGIDGAGSTMLSVVHVTENGKPMDNAYWNGKFMAYGDGNQSFKPLAGSLDVTAHEMTHGVINATVNLEYKFQSGALNESFADVFGTMVDSSNWKLGEDVVNPAVFKSGAMRDMENPHNGATQASEPGWQPAHMDEFLQLSLEDDNGGVHINSGIPNHACFLIAKELGRQKTEKIYYRVLAAKYLNPGSQFIDMRLAAIQAATDLYGEASPEVSAVKNGFASVGIGASATPDKPTPRPPDLQPVDGQEFVAMVGATIDDHTLYVAKAVVKGDSDIAQLTPTQVFTETGNPITITDDGSVLLFIDADNNLRGIDELGEQIVSDAGIWKSIAVSPDGSKVAATTLEPDAKIYIIDLAKPDDSKTISLYTPTTGAAIKANNVVYADALDFNSTGDFLLYDALNRVTQVDGDPIEYFDANLLDIKKEIITPFLPTRPDGIHIANPSFAQTSDMNIAFDLLDETANLWKVITADLFTGDFKVVDSSDASPGYPRYSTRDNAIVYQRFENNALGLRQMPLSADHYTAAGPSIAYVNQAGQPVWFAVGKRPAGLRLPGQMSSRPYAMHTDPGSGLLLDLPEASEVAVALYDLSGRLQKAWPKQTLLAGKQRMDLGSQRSGLYVVRVEIHPPMGPLVNLSRTMAVK